MQRYLAGGFFVAQRACTTFWALTQSLFSSKICLFIFYSWYNLSFFNNFSRWDSLWYFMARSLKPCESRTAPLQLSLWRNTVILSRLDKYNYFSHLLLTLGFTISSSLLKEKMPNSLPSVLSPLPLWRSLDFQTIPELDLWILRKVLSVLSTCQSGLM